MIKNPYQTSDCGEYWDYNFKLNGLLYEASVNKKTGKIYINEDEYREDKWLAKD